MSGLEAHSFTSAGHIQEVPRASIILSNTVPWDNVSSLAFPLRGAFGSTLDHIHKSRNFTFHRGETEKQPGSLPGLLLLTSQSHPQNERRPGVPLHCTSLGLSEHREWGPHVPSAQHDVTHQFPEETSLSTHKLRIKTQCSLMLQIETGKHPGDSIC